MFFKITEAYAELGRWMEIEWSVDIRNQEIRKSGIRNQDIQLELDAGLGGLRACRRGSSTVTVCSRYRTWHSVGSLHLELNT